MAMESAGVASRSEMVMVVNSPHKTFMLARACATTYLPPPILLVLGKFIVDPIELQLRVKHGLLQLSILWPWIQLPRQ